MKSILIAITLLLSSSPLFAHGEHGTSTVNISGGSVSYATALGQSSQVATHNSVEINAGIYKGGNGVEGLTTGMAGTFAQGSGSIAAQSGVVGGVDLSLNAKHVTGEAGTAQIANITPQGTINHSLTKVQGKTMLNGWIDPIYIQGEAAAVSFDKAVDLTHSAGENGGKVWLDMAVHH
ncbi:MAG: hypothetical protein WCT49_01975 [Candidatus Paceibacterota bacterium]|nr:hypothetical protein [Candidatus Paceibacterota bacterium]